MKKLIIKSAGKYGNCCLCNKYTEVGKLTITETKHKKIKACVCFDCFATKLIGFLKGE